MSDFVFVIAVGSSNPRRSALRAFNIRQVCTEQCIQEVSVEEPAPMKVCDVVCQGHSLVVLTTTSTVHVFSIASSCTTTRTHSTLVEFNDSHIVLLPLQSARRIPLPPSASVPIRVVPLVDAAESDAPRSREDSLEAFGCEKDEEEEEEEREELRRLLLLNHDHTVDLVSSDGAERKQLSDDALCLFLVKGSVATPAPLRTSVLLFGQHRYNVRVASSLHS